MYRNPTCEMFGAILVADVSISNIHNKWYKYQQVFTKTKGIFIKKQHQAPTVGAWE